MLKNVLRFFFLLQITFTTLPSSLEGAKDKSKPKFIFHKRPFADCMWGIKFLKRPDYSVHHAVSRRGHNEVTRFFEMEAALCNGINGPIPTFSERRQEILKGRKSIVSLGEGNSDFIKELIDKATKPELIHAVDIIYEDIDAIPGGKDGMDPALRKFIKEHPTNYHGQPIQEFSITHQDGRPLMFDEMVSSYSLGFLILRQGPDILPALIANHLNQGGTLRIVGGFDADSWDRLKPFLMRWRSEGLISNYSDLDQLEEKNRNQLTIVR